jgi:hypothetical protein
MAKKRYDAEDGGQPLEPKILPDGAPNSLKVGVRLDKMKPFGGSLNEEGDCSASEREIGH